MADPITWDDRINDPTKTPVAITATAYMVPEIPNTLKASVNQLVTEAATNASNIAANVVEIATKVGKDPDFFQEYVFDSSNSELTVDALGIERYTHTINAGGSASVVSDTLQITAAGSGYSGIRYEFFPLETGNDYYVYLEARKISGDDAVWVIGEPLNPGQFVNFTPTTSWQKFEGKFSFNIAEFGLFISAPNALTNEVIQVRNVFVKRRTFVEEDHEDRIIVLEGGIPGAFDLQAAVTANENVFVPIGIHELTTALVIPSGRKIYGVRGKSIIKAGASLTRLVEIDSKTDITLKDLTFLGVGADTPLGGPLNAPAAGVVDTFAEAVAENNIGTKTGIYLNDSERINIEGCEISNFDAYGIENKLCGKIFEYGIKVSDNYLHDNYCNLKASDEAEYSTYVGNSFTLAQIGLRVDSGNNILSNNHIDKNRVGLVMTAGLNNSHGSFSCCTFNHNSLYGIALNELAVGEVFSACQIFYGDIYVKDAKGIVFSACEIGSTNVYADGNFVTGGMWMITNTIFFGGAINHNYLGNTSDLRLKNNHLADGTSSAAYNN